MATSAHSVTKSDRADEDGRDRAETTSTSADADVTANGPLFKVPAGEASATFRVGGRTLHFDSEDRTAGVLSESDLSRTVGLASANIDLPISRRNRDFSALGNLTLNANAEIDQLSDFGTLTADRRRPELVAGRSPEFHRQLDPRGRCSDRPAAWRSDHRNARCTSVRFHDRPDRARSPRSAAEIPSCSPTDATSSRSAATGSHGKTRTSGCAGEYVHSRLDRPVSSFPGRNRGNRGGFPRTFRPGLVRPARQRRLPTGEL